MLKFNRLTGVLAFAAVVLLGNPDTADAQTLTFNPNPVAFTIPGPGSSAGPSTVTVTSSAGAVNSVCACGISTQSGGNWLSASPASNGNTFTVSVSNTSALSPNTTYNGTLTVTANGSNVTGTLPVTLQVGNTATGGSGLVANPGSVFFTQTTGGTGGQQVVTLSNNGSPIPISNATFTPGTGGLTFVNISLNANGAVTLNVNNVATANGFYSGTLTLFSSAGQVNVPVTLSIGSGSSNLTASPSSVTFNVQTGGSAPAQNVTILFNGSPTSINGVSATTTTGQLWLLPNSQSGTQGTVIVGVNASGLSAGTYNGTVTVTTAQGSLSFPVTLTVGGIPTLIVNPTSLNFAYQTGTTAPPAQTISITTNGSQASFLVNATTASGGSGWLVVSPSGQVQSTPSTITVSVQPATLGPGTYTGNVVINTQGGTTNSSISIPVTFLVSNNPILTASPASLSFTTQVGVTPATQALALSSSSTSLSYTATSAVTTPAGGNWMQISQSGATPGSLTVGVNTQGLAPGTYSATINVSAPTAGNPSLSVPVTLTVTAGPVLQLNPSSLSFAFQTTQGQPGSQSVIVGSNSGQVGFSVAATTATAPNWLIVSPTTGTAPGNFVVSVVTTGLTAGNTYTGTITVTPTTANSPAQTIPVTLVVSATSLFLVSPGGISFSAQAGAVSTSFQTVSVASTDSTPIAFSVAGTTNTGGNWLLVSPTLATSPANLSITANPSALQVGIYTGTVTLTATSPANVANSPQNVSVTLNVLPNATLGVSSSSLAFSATTGGTPAPQTLSVTSSSGTITFAAQVNTNQGGPWLSVSPSNGSTPGTLTVTASGAGLSAGTYTGQIIISSPGAQNSQTVNVTLTVSNAPTIVVSPASLTPVSFQIGGASPAVQNINVSTVGGAAATFTTSAIMSNGAGWLSVSPATGTTPGNVAVTITPAGLTPGTYSGSLSITIAGASNSPVNLPITLTVTPAAIITPTVVAVQNAASFQFSPISPGLNVYISGSNMGPGTLTLYHIGANGTFDSSVAGTQVIFDGFAAPLIYTSSTQVSVMVPYEIAGRANVTMIVTYNGVGSAPFPLRVVDSSPGIYTINQSGSGPGAILNQNGSLNTAANPEMAGNVIQIYATGEGQTTPGGVDGAISPNRLPLPAPILPVTVTIGGIPVPASDITYAGEAPGIISGVIQVNARIPAGLTPGAKLVFISVGGAPSQANVTVAVR